MTWGDTLFPLPNSKFWQIAFHIESRDLLNSSISIEHELTALLEQRYKAIAPFDEGQSGFHKTLPTL